MIGRESGDIWAVFGGLLVFGVLYNALYAWLERHGYDEGYLAFIVAGGLLGISGGLALLDWQWALLTLGACAAAGLPMIIGSWWRHVRRRRASQQALRAEVL